jgi:Domain of unknown function (DUF4249)
MFRLSAASIFSYLVLFSFLGCVTAFEADFILKADIMTVEGLVTDQEGTTIYLNMSYSFDRSIKTLPIKNCKVEILAGNGTKVSLTESAPGVYVTPTGFKGVAGQTYQLFFTTADGKSYQSTVEQMTASPDIKKAYSKFNEKGLLDNTGQKILASTFDVFVDLQDPADQKNYYLWQWNLYEKMDYCVSCEKSFYNPSTKQCEKDPRPFIMPPNYDYRCQGNCWDIYSNTDINILSDVYSNGKIITGKRIAQVPYYSEQGALIEIQQYTLTADAYNYYALLRDQVQTNGTLTDTPPAPILGNITNKTDANEKIVGYFAASGGRKIRYWIDRKGFTGTKIQILGHEPKDEPDSPPGPPTFIARPPTAVCEPSRTRTPNKPAGWQ